MLSLTRRRALAAGVAAALAQSPLAGRLSAATGDLDLAALETFLDILLPADDLTPSAGELRVASQIVEIAAPTDPYRRLLALGTFWLNGEGARSFASLSAADRHKVVAWMSRSDIDAIPGRFYQVVRQSAVEIYFSHPQALAGLPVNPAPQPLGYPPPWR